MNTANRNKKSTPTVQCVNIDLPGEAVKCWRSSDNVRVILKKHRDVVFDINLLSGAAYTVESKSDFYSPVLKRLTRRVDFLDGDLCHLWVGRQFKDELLLKMNGRMLGSYRVDCLDTSDYGPDPKVKPEPLMIIMGQRRESLPFVCTPNDPFGVGEAQSKIMSSFEPKFSIMRELGTKFDYSHLRYTSEVKEYVAVTDAGFIVAAVLIDKIDDGLGLKKKVANLAR